MIDFPSRQINYSLNSLQNSVSGPAVPSPGVLPLSWWGWGGRGHSSWKAEAAWVALQGLKVAGDGGDLVLHLLVDDVEPLTLFFSVSSSYKIIDLPGGKSMTPRQWYVFLFCSSRQLPRLHLWPLKDFLSWHSVLQGLSTCLAHCFWNYRDTRTPSGVAR